MTQHTDVYTTGGTITEPDNLVSTNVTVTAIGGGSEYAGIPGFFFAFLLNGAYVSGQIPASLFPLTVVIGGSANALSGNGANGYSGGGAAPAGPGGTAIPLGGGGSTAVLSGSTLLIEAGGADGGSGFDASGGTAIDPGGSGGGYASNTPHIIGDYQGSGTVAGAGSGGSQGGNGANSDFGSGGTGAGGGTNGNGPSGAFSGPGVGSGGLVVANVAASFAASSVIGYQYGSAPANFGSVTVVYNTADAPSTPTLVSPPASDFVDVNADGVTLVGTYVTPGPDTGSLVGVAVSLKIDGGTVHYWNGTNFTSTSPVYLTPDTGLGATNGEDFSVVIPAGVLADGHTYTWGLACQESFADLEGSFSATQSFTGQVAPSAVITAPTATEATLTPPLAWTPTTPAGSQTHYRFVVYSAPTDAPGSGSPVYDSGLVASSTHSGITLPSSTFNSVATYYGYLQITETGGQTSEWELVVFTVQLADSATPSLSGSVTTEPTSGMPASHLSATTSGGISSPTIRFQASYDGGETWADVLGLAAGVTEATATVPVVSGSASLYDMGAPFNVALKYRCRNEAVSGGETYISAWSSVVTL